MYRVRRVRVLIYEGPAEWVQATTENPNRYVNGRRVLSQVKRPPSANFGEIVPIPEPPLEDNMVITEYLTDEVEAI